MEIRRARVEDIPGIDKLLYQVHKVHSDGRPDVFKAGEKKYTDEELVELLKDDERPIYVAVEDGKVLGYSFLVFEYMTAKSMINMKSIYIDDICVDEEARGKHVGTALYENVIKVAKESGCAKITLNVWCLNTNAMKFYEAVGLTPLKIVMEKKL